MCLLFAAWRVNEDFPLVVAANRDEFHDRPTAPLAWWEDAPDVAAGRDLRARGTWLGVSRAARMVALTNVRDPLAGAGSRSRGLLVSECLTGDQPLAKQFAEISRQGAQYAPFNLLACDGHELLYMNNCRAHAPEPLAAGVYGLSNGLLDDPWPKVERGRKKFARLVKEGAEPEALLAMLADRTTPPDAGLPDTGVGIERERLLSPMFIRSDDYGTRCSTVVRFARDGRTEILERRYDASGEAVGDTRIAFDTRADTSFVANIDS